MPTQWTPQQRQAIETTGGSLLVSAAAGAGKTAVLTQRVLAHLTHPEHPVDANRLLIVTFTRLAAAEMKSRIAAGLSRMIEAQPASVALRRQQVLLQSAKISTIDAFCQGLLRENFHLLDIPPDFRIADPKELELMRSEAMAQTLEALYRQPGGEFARLVELLSTGKNDKRTEETLLRLYDFLRALPFPERWLQEKQALYQTELPPEQTPWGKLVLEHARSGIACALTLTRQALEAMQGDEALSAAYQPALLLDEKRLAALQLILQTASWDAACQAFEHFTFEKLGRLTKYPYEEKKAHVTALREGSKDIIKELRDRRFCCTAAEFARDMQLLRPCVEQLFAALRLFSQQLESAKAAKGVLDFPDLTHHALRLLVEQDEQGRPQQTPLARQLSEELAEVLVDEYQDTNQAQDLLFWAVSGRGQRLFMVGDVKQSIYRFRQAMPELFLEKQRSFAPVGGGFPAKVVLGRNFRSHSAITGAVNHVFSLLMSRSLGELDYDQEHWLEAGAQYPPDEGAGLSLHVLEPSQSEEPEGSEAAYVAGLVAQLLESGFEVVEQGAARPARPGDIAVLLRSKGKAQEYVQALAQRGVSAWCESQGGFLSSPEVGWVVALLSALSNPLLDLPLVQAMLSPMFGFSSEDIAQLRLQQAGRPFYLLVQQAAQTQENWRQFLECFAALRRQGALLPADTLIRQIYLQTSLPELVLAMPQGQMRQANLRLLVNYAADYEQAGYKGLDGFVRFLARLREQGSDLSTASLRTPSAVSVMSIHASKGLEFPVVILADCARRFNTDDLRRPGMLSARLGFACTSREPGSLVSYTTLPLEALRIEGAAASLSEELRVLYVALTRAKQRLYAVASLPRPAKQVAGLALPLEKGRLAPWAVGSANSFADWLIMAALHHPGGQPLRELAGLPPVELAACAGQLQVRLAQPGTSLGLEVAQAEAPPPPSPALLAELQERLAFAYPHTAATQTPAKLAVSQLVAHEAITPFGHAPRPAFLQGKGLSAAQAGTALHLFLQLANLAQAQHSSAAEKQRLVQEGFLSPQQAQAVNEAAVAAFLAGPLGQRLLAAKQCHRELRFLCEADSILLGSLAPWLPEGQTTMLQGVVDCLFIEEDGAVLIDYKTDRLENEQLLLARHGAQLRLYARVVQQWMKLPVKQGYLYSFHLGKAVAVDL